MNRRRLSSFRPTGLVYPMPPLHDHVTEEVTLEDLPHAVLVEISYHLHTKDLLTLCVLSRFTYLPAALVLYEKLLLGAEMMEAQAHVDNWAGTIVHNLDHLTQVLSQNLKLAQLVRSVVASNVTLDIRGLLQAATPTSVFLRTVPFSEVGDLVQNVTDLGISARGKVAATKMPNLRLLKVWYDDGFDGIVLLVHSLQGSPNLDVLEFQRIPLTLNRLESMNIANSAISLTLPAWFQFFHACRELGIRLSLRRLALDGHIEAYGPMVAALIGSVVDLSGLQWLQLCCREYTHRNSSHGPDDWRSNLVHQLVQLTPNLTHLAVNPTYDCLICQCESLCASLRVLAHKLEVVSLRVELMGPSLLLEVIEVVAKYQNLRRLRLHDRSTAQIQQKSLFQILPKRAIEDYKQSIYFEDELADTLFADEFLRDFLLPKNKHMTNFKQLTNDNRDLRQFLNHHICELSCQTIPDVEVLHIRVM